MNARTIGSLVAFIAAAAIGGLFGYNLASDCTGVGPVPDLAENLFSVIVAVLTAILLVVAAFFVRRRVAQLYVAMATIGFAGAFFVALAVVDQQCPPPTSFETRGSGSLELGSPYLAMFAGGISCTLDADGTTTVAVQGSGGDPEQPGWQANDLDAEVYFIVAERTTTRQRLELTLIEDGRGWTYRDTSPDQIQTVPNGREGLATITDVPLFDDSRPERSPVPETISGELRWECDTP